MRKIKLLLVALFASIGMSAFAQPADGDVGYLYNVVANKFISGDIVGADGKNHATTGVTGIKYTVIIDGGKWRFDTGIAPAVDNEGACRLSRCQTNSEDRITTTECWGWSKWDVKTVEGKDGFFLYNQYAGTSSNFAKNNCITILEDGTLTIVPEADATGWEFVNEYMYEDYVELAVNENAAALIASVPDGDMDPAVKQALDDAVEAFEDNANAETYNALAEAIAAANASIEANKELAETKDALALMNEGAGPQVGDELLAVLFANAGFDESNGADGWTVTMDGGNNPSYKVENGNCAMTKYQGTIRMEKTIKGLPAGWYTLKAQAFARTGNNAANIEAFNAGEILDAPGVIFANGVTKQVKNVVEGPVAEKGNGNYTEITVDGNTMYILDNSNSGSYVFSTGQYETELIVYLAEGEALTFGFDKTTANDADYCGCDNFRLVYEGADMPQTFDEGKYYLYNVEAGKFWGAGTDWGTRASLVDHAEYITLHYAATGYTLESQVEYNGGHFFNGDYMDNGSPKSLFIVPFGKYYKIYANDAVYGYDGTSTVLGKNVQGDAAAWQIFSEEDMKAQLAKATAKEPVDATWMIQDPNFGRNNRYQNAWTMAASNQNLSGGNNTNNCAESYHSNFTLSQVISGAPKGTYALTAQGFYRQDGSDNENLPVFYANDKTGTFPLKTGGENSMADASASFTNGSYTIEPIIFEVGDNGEITLGAKLENNTALWCIWDNFVLKYYGPDASELDVKAAQAVEDYQKALAAAQAVDQTAKMTAASKQALAEALETYAEDKVLTEEATKESIEAATEALAAATAAATTSINSYKIIAAGVVPDNSLDGWVCENTNTFHINTWSVEGNPGNDPSGMVTPFIENWVGKGSFLGAGKVYYQLAGLEPGEVYYAQALVRSYNEANADAPNGPNFFINDTYVDMTEAGNTFTYNGMSGIYATLGGAATVGEDGTLTLGVEINADRNYNWVAFKSVSIMPMADALAKAVEAAKAYLNVDMAEDAKEDLKAVIEAYDGATFNTVAEYEEAIAALTEAAEAARVAAEDFQAIAGAEEILAKMKAFAETTNVYTQEAYDEYYTQYYEKFEAGTLTADEARSLQDPTKTTGVRSALTVDDLLLSVWTAGGTQCKDFTAALYINTWSTEANNKENGSGMFTPFFEYWVSDANAVAANKFQATMTDLEDGVYDVEALVRVRIKNNGGEAASGVTLQVAEGTPVDVCAGETCDDGAQFRYGVFTAEGEITDGTLTITFDVAADNNISWLTFRNVKFEKVGEPTKIAGVTEKAAQKAIFNAAGQQMKNLQKGINIVDGAKVYMK